MEDEMELGTNFKDRLAAMWSDIESGYTKAEVERAKSDPHANRLTRVFDVPLRYRYFSGRTDKHGESVRYCWTTVTNCAGYYLFFVERWSAPDANGDRTGRRDEYTAHKRRKDAKRTAEIRWYKDRSITDESR